MASMNFSENTARSHPRFMSHREHMICREVYLPLTRLKRKQIMLVHAAIVWRVADVIALHPRCIEYIPSGRYM